MFNSNCYEPTFTPIFFCISIKIITAKDHTTQFTETISNFTLGYALIRYPQNHEKIKQKIKQSNKKPRKNQILEDKSINCLIVGSLTFEPPTLRLLKTLNNFILDLEPK